MCIISGLLLPISLPKDQDCHEMWCKNRKKHMKEAQKRGEDISSLQSNTSKGNAVSSQSSIGKMEGKEIRSSSSDRTLPVKAKASVSGTNSTSKAPVGIFNRKDKVSGTSGIPGLDVATQEQPAEAPPTEDRKETVVAPVNNQLSQMIALLQKGMSVPDVAKSVNVTLDEQTQQLMSNLNAQLMLAAQLSKDQRISEPSSHLETVNQGPYSSDGYRQDYGNHSTSNMFGGSKGDGSGEGNSNLYSLDSNNSSGVENAGVKAALAQLLAQQGMRVSLGGTEISASEAAHMSQTDTYSKPDGGYYSSDRPDYSRPSSYTGGGVYPEEGSRGSYSSGGDNYGGQYNPPSSGSGGSGYYGQYSGEGRPPPKSYSEAAQGVSKPPKSILKNKSSSSAPSAKPAMPSMLDQNPVGGYSQLHSGHSGNPRGGRGGWN